MVGTDESTEVCGPCFVARVFGGVMTQQMCLRFPSFGAGCESLFSQIENKSYDEP